ncbi:hypothetical protein [uncultured Clostridium sp.]|uniref:hypothetical protein n=1 Tax=uncultured Clostridium sp. TaxID=59620 RepID=UPI0032178018
MSLLKEEEIEYIEKVYEETKSIVETAKITGFAKNTVNKYVKFKSSQDKRSRDKENNINQINLSDNTVIAEWFKPSIASKELNINPAEICRVLKGELKQAGGYGWEYKSNRN